MIKKVLYTLETLFCNRANPVKFNRLYSGSNQNEESKNFDRVKKRPKPTLSAHLTPFDITFPFTSTIGM